LLYVLGVLLGIAGAAFEQPQVTGDSDVVAGFAMAFAGYGVALLPAGAVVEVRVGGMGAVSHRVGVSGSCVRRRR